MIAKKLIMIILVTIEIIIIITGVTLGASYFNTSFKKKKKKI